jgi:hypothetical protein
MHTLRHSSYTHPAEGDIRVTLARARTQRSWRPQRFMRKWPPNPLREVVNPVETRSPARVACFSTPFTRTERPKPC